MLAHAQILGVVLKRRRGNEVKEMEQERNVVASLALHAVLEPVFSEVF